MFWPSPGCGCHPNSGKRVFPGTYQAHWHAIWVTQPQILSLHCNLTVLLWMLGWKGNYQSGTMCGVSQLLWWRLCSKGESIDVVIPAGVSDSTTLASHMLMLDIPSDSQPDVLIAWRKTFLVCVYRLDQSGLRWLWKFYKLIVGITGLNSRNVVFTSVRKGLLLLLL